MADQDNNIYHIEDPSAPTPVPPSTSEQQQQPTATQQQQPAPQQQTAMPPRQPQPQRPYTRPSTETAQPAGVPPANGTVLGGEPTGDNGGKGGNSTNRKLWIAVIVLAAIIVIGLTWILATHYATSGEDKPLADTTDTSANTVDVLDYQTDNSPADTAGTAPEANAQEEQNTQSPEAQPTTQQVSLSGTMASADGSATSSVKLNITIDDQGNVNGTSQAKGSSFSVYGHYDKGTHRMNITEEGGGQYSGQYKDGNFSSGHYVDADGKKWTLNL